MNEEKPKKCAWNYHGIIMRNGYCPICNEKFPHVRGEEE